MVRPIFAAALFLSVTFWGRLFAPEHDPRYHRLGIEIKPFRLTERSGKSVTLDSLRGIYTELERRGLSADNLFCGMGGGLLQRVNRDTLNFGQKASAVCINGKWKDISKAPTGDPMKHSKAGRLALQYVDGDYRTVRRESIPPEENLLQPVFRNESCSGSGTSRSRSHAASGRFPSTTTPTPSPR